MLTINTFLAKLQIRKIIMQNRQDFGTTLFASGGLIATYYGITSLIDGFKKINDAQRSKDKAIYVEKVIEVIYETIGGFFKKIF